MPPLSTDEAHLKIDWEVVKFTVHGTTQAAEEGAASPGCRRSLLGTSSGNGVLLEIRKMETKLTAPNNNNNIFLLTRNVPLTALQLLKSLNYISKSLKKEMET